MNIPKITIVTVTYNCKDELEKTILSVINQNYQNIEYIIIDGASTDGTLDLIQKYKNNITKVVSEPDKGIYDAMNKAISLATGQWINFLNAGDIYANNNVISNLFYLTDIPSKIKILYGQTKLIYQNSKCKFHNTAKLDEIKKVISKYQPYTHQAVFYEISNKADCLFNLKYRICADYDVACRYWKKYGIDAYLYNPTIICYYKAYDGVSTNPLNKKILRKEHILIKYKNKMNVIEIIKDTIKFIFL